MFFKNNCSEEEDVPYSPGARLSLSLNCTNLYFWIILFAVAFIIGLIIFVIIVDIILIVFWLLIFSLIFLAFYFKIREKTKRAKERNLIDYKSALELENRYNVFLKKELPDFFVISHEDKIEEDGWRPQQIKRHTNAVMSGEVKGEMLGFYSGLFSGYFGGNFRGNFSGDIVQDILNQGIEVTLVKGEEVLRLFTPSSAICELDLMNTLKNAWNYYGRTYRGYQFLEMLRSEKLKTLFEDKRIGSHVYDVLEASLTKPFEERPVVKVRGILKQEGVILACIISLDGGEPKMVFPIEIVFQVKKMVSDAVTLKSFKT